MGFGMLCSAMRHQPIGVASFSGGFHAKRNQEMIS
jgi:hypothetical protein